MRQPRWRKKRRDDLKASGIRPTNAYRLCCVSAANTAILPAWLKSRLVRGLASVPGRYWLLRSDALALITFFRTISVRYSLVQMDFHRCARCDRPVIGMEAEALRKAMETVTDRRTVTCGPNCDRDRALDIWRQMKKVAA